MAELRTALDTRIVQEPILVWILGISAYYHDSAAALIHDNDVVAAAQEERFNRQKHYPGFPTQAITYCLQEAGISLADIDSVVFYEKPFLKFERLLETYHAFAPTGIVSFLKSMPTWLKDKLFQKQVLLKELNRLAPGIDFSTKLLFSEHHLSHAASAYYPSPFEHALILTMDGSGEWATTTVMEGQGSTIKLLKEIRFPHSLGLLYSAFTYFCGFKVNSGEYKLMGLAPYGKPVYVDLIRDKLIHIAADGSFRLNMRYFNYCTGLTMTNKHFNRLFGRPPRTPESAITQIEMDLARSVQVVVEQTVLQLCRSLRQEYGLNKLCLAGGVALNCVANGKLIAEQIFDDVWIQPAAGDSGAALGAALTGYHLHHQQSRPAANKYGKFGDAMKGGYLGPSFDNNAIEAVLRQSNLPFQKLDNDQLIARAASAIANSKVIGWFQGRMEFGPRALGNRSILGDPRSSTTQSRINKKIKFRESFRPFAPSVLKEDASSYFQLNCDSPYMLVTADLAEHRRTPIPSQGIKPNGLEQIHQTRSEIPAVTHVDYSARIQTVSIDDNPLYYKLINEYKRLTGFSLIVNTSFNIRGEPIVCTPQDALECFLKTEMDELYLGIYRVTKKDLHRPAAPPSITK
ncbi:MAG: carbamoyltransferase [Halopseudomonas sp.]